MSDTAPDGTTWEEYDGDDTAADRQGIADAPREDVGADEDDADAPDPDDDGDA